MMEEARTTEKASEIATPEAWQAYYRLAEDFLRAGGHVTFREWQGLEPEILKLAMVEAGNALRRELVALLVAGLGTPDEGAEIDHLLAEAARSGLGGPSS